MSERSERVHQMIVPSNITPNGPLHVGHLAGPLLGADVLRRACRQQGEQASLMIGTAWQYSHVGLEAALTGSDPLQFAIDIGRRIEASFEQAQVVPDFMLRSNEAQLIDALSRLAFRSLHRAGLLCERRGQAQYCVNCAEFRFQGFATGRCPRCGSSDASGVDCEGCAHYHDDVELLTPHCAICDAPTVPRPVTRVYLELERLRGWFVEYFEGVQMDASICRFAEDVMSRPLPSVAITWPNPDSPAAPTPFGPHQRIFPAFEIASRYVVMARRLAVGPADSDADRRMTMLFGFDNAFERVFLFPAILRAIDDVRAPLPAIMHMTYFALLDGSKFSTSRRHVISLDDAVAGYGSDEVRLYVAARRPEREPTDLSATEILRSVEVQAVRALQAWARTGEAPGPLSTTPASWAALADAAWQFDRAVRPGQLCCPTAARSLTTVTDIALGAARGREDPDLARAALERLVAMGSVLIPTTAQALASALHVSAVTSAENRSSALEATITVGRSW